MAHILDPDAGIDRAFLPVGANSNSDPTLVRREDYLFNGVAGCSPVPGLTDEFVQIDLADQFGWRRPTQRFQQQERKPQCG